MPNISPAPRPQISAQLRLPFAILATFLGSSCWQSTSCQAQSTPDYNRDIRPILSNHCFACHGPDAAHRQADLRLDQQTPAIDKKAILPGSPQESEMIARILSQDPDLQMPPPESNKPLSDKQIQTLKTWIEQGAQYQTHWAYIPPTRPPISSATGKTDAAGKSSLDYWVEVELAKQGIPTSPRAERRTLIRRLYSDLIGLPPTPEQVAAFENDSRPDAYRLLVEELLSNPHYGERMAIGWLDVVRFADTIGYHSDNPRNIWPYRDYVIASFNSNKPFDRFTIEQLAGDLLPDANQETKLATAFNRLILSTEEGGAQPKDYEARMLADRVRAIGTVWLGQTIGCAQCHDHKYDPITTKDFYSLGAFFADIQEGIVATREVGMPILTDEQQRELRRIEEDPNTRDDPKVREDFLKSVPKCLVTNSTATSSPEKRRVVRILPRGNWMDESGEIVQPAFPIALHHSNSPSGNITATPKPIAPKPIAPKPITPNPLTRLDLANWLVSQENPLTARVVMNRLWKHFFGTGLSKVLDDLGAQGETPINQPLLDTMACEFIESGWDVKHMVRWIVLSETYQRSTQADPTAVAQDPLNRYTGRQSSFRLDAELIRDQALAIGGLLSPRIGGPSAKPYQPEGYWENLNFPTRTYSPDSGEQQYRRGIYTWWQRTFLHPSLLAFDAPSREECSAERSRSNIPQQALVLLNDPTYVEAAQGFARRAIEAIPAPDANPQWQADRIAWMVHQTLQRPATPTESELLANLIVKQAKRLSQSQRSSDSSEEKSLQINELNVWTHAARVLLNLHETITRN